MSAVRISPATKTDHALDLEIACPHKHCLVAIGEPCRKLAPRTVHFARRLKRLLRGVRE